MERLEPGSYRIPDDVPTGGVIVPAGTLIIIPSEDEQHAWRKLKAPAVASEGV